MNMPDSHLPTVYLKPGEACFSVEPTVVSTVLGSCVSVTMFSRKRLAGGICHGMLPDCDRWDSCERTDRECFKFMDCAINNMVYWFEQRGMDRRGLEVKLFGGSSITEFRPGEHEGLNVGGLNIRKATSVLEGLRLRVVASDTGGQAGRKLLFYTHTGTVLMKHLGERVWAG